MKTVKSVLLATSIGALLTVQAHASTPSNAGFETGDLAGWTQTNGVVEVVTDADDAIVTPPFGEHFTATQGLYFARLTAGSGDGVYTSLSQAFSLTGASQLSFDAAFLAFDYLDYNDDAYVKILGLGGEELLFASSVAAVGDQGHTSWAHFTSGPLAVGNYVLEAGVRNIGDPDPTYSSQLLMDNISISAIGSTAVPEPTTWVMLILGFGAVGSLARAKRGARQRDGQQKFRARSNY